jgi:hypothetical protein
MVYPVPEKLIHEFASKVKKIYVIEELDPYLEEQIKAMGIEVTGKEIFPYTNEFDPGIVKKAINSDRSGAVSPYHKFLPIVRQICARLSSSWFVLRTEEIKSLCPWRYRLLYTLLFKAPGRSSFLHLHGRQDRHGPRNEQGP